MKRKEPLKVPRASLAVTLLADPELIELLQTPEGRDAALLFVCLILAAKEQNNAGRFTQGHAVLAMLVRWPLSEFKSALDYLLRSPGQWVVSNGGEIVVRGFTKWNSGWGGAREGAGRPTKTESTPDSSRNQVKPTPPLPVSVPVSVGPPDLPEAAELQEFLQVTTGVTVDTGRLIREVGADLAIVEAERRASRGQAAFKGADDPVAVMVRDARRREPPVGAGSFASWKQRKASAARQHAEQAEQDPLLHTFFARPKAERHKLALAAQAAGLDLPDCEILPDAAVMLKTDPSLRRQVAAVEAYALNRRRATA